MKSLPEALSALLLLIFLPACEPAVTAPEAPAPATSVPEAIETPALSGCEGNEVEEMGSDCDGGGGPADHNEVEGMS